MQKEFEKQEKLRTMDEDHRKKYEEELKQQQQKHNQHERVHHPGNKAQLEEGSYQFHSLAQHSSPIALYQSFFSSELVWEKQDHMAPEDFDPKTFFMMHGK